MKKLPFPRESDSQEIGQRAKDALLSQRPRAWRPLDLSGDVDVGIDLQFQVLNEGQYEHVFRAQLKGSTTDCRSGDKSFFSVPLKVSTANFLSRVGPVMLIFVDFFRDPDHRTARIYYAWLHEQLRNRLQEIENEEDPQKELTFRVPTNQPVELSLDIRPYLDAYVRQEESLSGLKDAIKGAGGGAPPEIAANQLTANLDKGGALFLESTTGDGGFPWPEATKGTNAWYLRELRDAVSSGADSDALRLETKVLELELRDDVEKAESAFQRGRLALLRGQSRAAVTLFQEAVNLRPNSPRFICARIDARLTIDTYRDVATQEIADLGSSAIAEDPRIQALRARLLMILDRFEEATALLSNLSSKDSIIEKMLLASLVHDNNKVAELQAEALSLDIPRSTLLSVKILAARALFWDVFNVESGQQIPASGPAQLDASRVQECWTVLSELANELERNRWPINSHLLLDVLCAAAPPVGRANEALVLIEDFLQERPHYVEFQSLRMKMALHADKLDIALRAVGALPDDHSRPVHEVLISYSKGDYQRATAAIPRLLAIESTDDELFADALLVAALCASRLFKTLEADACLVRLKELPNSEPLIALHRFVLKAGAEGTEYDAVLAELVEAYNRDTNSSAIQDHLITALRPKVSAEATLALTVAEQISARRMLFPQEEAHLAHCLDALGRRRDAIVLLERARKRIPDSVEIASLQALFYERAGDTAKALAELEALLQSDNRIAERCRWIYINVASRSGLTELAT